VVGATGYSWTATGGAPTTGSGTSFTWTAPTTPGTFDINLTYLTACPPNATAATCVVTVGSPTCSFAYVAPGIGKDSTFAGGPDVPYKTIAYALTQLAGRTKLRLAVGTYNETVPLVIQNNLVFDGGFIINNGIWSKSNSDSTYIICTGTQAISASVAHRVGFVSNGASNWELQDLVIQTTDIASTTTNGEGYSNYGVLAYNNSANFKIIRTKVYAGAAANGANGVTPSGTGSGGAGGGGGGGGNGGGNGANKSSQPGSPGSAGNAGASGGAGGSGCSTGSANTVGCGVNGCTGGGNSPLGQLNTPYDGAAGTAGSGYTAGNRPASPAASGVYYAPAAQAASGQPGTGGGGGGGGGGGTKGTSCTCTYGNGAANGGAGGNGGNGGAPGSGGWGGGGSFAIYANGAGTTGTIITSVVLPGNAGTGGAGAAGQAANTGNNGAAGINVSGSCGTGEGVGGNGGRGGDGGNGGRGQDGANGISLAIATTGGAFVNGSSTGVPNNYIIGINYNNAKACIYSEISLTKSTGVWTFPASLNLENDVRDVPAGTPATSYNASSSPVVVYTTTPNTDIDLIDNGLTYNAYLKIAPDNRILPAITLTNHTICLNGSITLSATHWGAEQEYDWRVYQGAAVNSPLFQSTVATPFVDFTGYAAGTYIIRYKVRESCCGWSIPVYDTVKIDALPIQYTVQGGGTFCPGGTGVPISLNGSEPGVEYIVYYNGAAVDSMVGTGASPLVFANETQPGIYTISGYRFNGCGQPMLGFVNISLSPTPTQFNVTGGGNACPGATTGPNIYLNGSQLGVSYQLYLNGTTPVGNPVQGTGNQIPFVNQGQAGTYTVIGTFIASPYCSAKMTDSVTIQLIALPNAYNLTGGGSYCAGDSGRTIGLSHSDLSVTYSLYTGGVLVAGPIAGTGSAISFGTFTLTGSYNAIATNIAGCDTAMNNTVIINQLPVPVIISVTSSNLSCFGGTNDTINIAATSPDGAISYSITNGLTYPGTTGLFTNLTAGDYYIVVKDDSGCTTRYAANPVVLSQPTAPLAVSSTVTNITCSGANNGAINLLVSGGWGAYTYAWTSGQTVSYIGGLPAATYTATVTDIRGCQASVTNTIVNPTPIASQVTVTNVTCAGAQNGSAHLTVGGGTAPYTFLWSDFSTTQDIDSLTGGTYYVIITDANGCQKRDSGIVHEGLPIAVSDTFVPISCSGSNNASIHVIVSGGTGTYTYTWSPSGPNSPDNTNLSANTYSVTVSDANGCSASTSVVITAPSPLTVGHVVTNPRCNSGNDGTITMIVSGGTPTYNYAWAGGILSGGVISNVQAGTYYVTVTDAHGCSASDSIVVTDPAPMYISGIPKNVTCAGNMDGDVIATGYGGTLPYSYQWHYDSLAGPLGPITKDWLQLSGGDYYLIITDANNCTVSYHAVIKEADSLKISLVETDATCQSANSGAVAVLVTGGVRPYGFLWNNFVTDSFQTGIPGGNYGVVVTDSNGCHQTQTINVNGQPDPMTVNVAVNNPTCNGGTNGFISLDVLGGVQPYVYNWTTTPVQNGNIATDLSSGTYYVTVTDSKGCQLADSATLTSPVPISATTSIGGATCVSASDGYVVINVTGGNGPYSYQLGSTIQSTDTFTNLSVGTYTLVVKDANGCEGSTSLDVRAPGYFTVDLTATPNYILSGESVQLNASAQTDTAPGQIVYQWNPADSLNFQGCTDSANCNDPIANPHRTRTYTVTAINARGCVVMDTVLVTVSSQPSIFIPTAFTPNGDGLNDRFEFAILGSVSADVQIWNRWGEKVYSNPNQLNGITNTTGWDGSFRGKGVQYDTYTYQLNVTYTDGHKENIAGTVVVMK
jgi:gliding motility-associated-like protein